MAPVTKITSVPDSAKTHWVNRSPERLRPYLQLSRLDRPVGYWLLALPGWVGLAFAGLSHGLLWTDLKWAALILIGAIAMRGAGCTYNDIVDQDLDAQVERTALRPLPAGTVSTKQAWAWLFAQCAVGLIVLLLLPRLAQIVSLLSIPLVAAYPFMKRITWWPQVWLGLTFNWAVLVAYAAKTGELSLPLFILYVGLMFWTVGYDTIYACQDIEDDAFVGIKSTARRFGGRVLIWVSFFYLIFFGLTCLAFALTDTVSVSASVCMQEGVQKVVKYKYTESLGLLSVFLVLPVSAYVCIRLLNLKKSKIGFLDYFKSEQRVAFFLIVPLIFISVLGSWLGPYGFSSDCSSLKNVISISNF